ncbi:MAG: hypothetical protein Greene041662_1011 [Candidatus Peregrinibacteria bacterium Greene0416_62]|nr:MAG: hypothetical protein Greene041662_1011 [Candidatus Peregrinibacteria bacterium Greene0416_62]
MQLTDTDIGEFRELWRKETGQEIPTETARQYAEDILGIIAIVAEPLTRAREEKPP